MKESKLLISALIVILSNSALAFTDVADAYKNLQQKVQATISSNRMFYSCESDFGKPSYYYQGSQSYKWYSINVAGLVTPKANMNLVNEILTATVDNSYFQTVYKKEFNLPEEGSFLSHTARPSTETITFVFSAQLGQTPRIQHSYKRGTFGYYSFFAKGSCQALSIEQFDEQLKNQIGL